MTPPLVHPSVFRFPLILTIDKTEPAMPVEGEGVRIFFTLKNRTGAPLSGAVSSPQGGEAQIADLPTGSTVTGSVQSTAPTAGSAVPIRLQFFKRPPPPGIEFPPPDAEGTSSIDVAGRFTFTIDSFQIFKTRAIHNDTDFVGLEVTVNEVVVADEDHPDGLAWKRMGDVNDGGHRVGLSRGPFVVAPTDRVVTNFQIVNAGYDLGGWQTFFDKVSGATAGVLKAIYKDGDWTKGDDLTQYINSVQFADCDGITALDFIDRTGAKLIALTSDTGKATLSRRYPGSDIGPEEYKVYKSADGCGGTSDYSVTYTIERVSMPK